MDAKKREKRRRGESRTGGVRGRGQEQGMVWGGVSEGEKVKRGKAEKESDEEFRNGMETVDVSEVRRQNSARRVHKHKKAFKLFYKGVSRSGLRALEKEIRAMSKEMEAKWSGVGHGYRGSPKDGERSPGKKVREGLSILSLLESRADRVLWRSGRVSSRAMARDMIRQGHVYRRASKVNTDRRRTAQGYVLKPGDSLMLKTSVYDKRAEGRRKKWESEGMAVGIPSYLEVDFQRGRVCFESAPLDGEVLRPVGLKRTLASLKGPFKK